MSKKILIIDDDSGDRELILNALRQEIDCEVSQASSGEEGIAKLGQLKPDIIILDTKLPGLDGFETCRKIKELGSSQAKIIMMTGAIDAVDAVKARKHGADDYCAKSPDNEDIVEAVKNLE